MLYGEFIEGTGCKDNDFNYKVYKNLEELYMANDSITKEDVYKAGKKLVDNSKTQTEIEFEKQTQKEVNELREANESYKKEIEMYKGFIEYWPNEDHKEWKYQISWRRNIIIRNENAIKEYKYFFKFIK